MAGCDESKMAARRFDRKMKDFGGEAGSHWRSVRSAQTSSASLLHLLFSSLLPGCHLRGLPAFQSLEIEGMLKCQPLTLRGKCQPGLRLEGLIHAKS